MKKDNNFGPPALYLVKARNFQAAEAASAGKTTDRSFTMTSRKLIVAAAIVGLGSGLAFAQDDAGPRRQGPRDGEGRARMLEQFDRDGDGQISDEERAAAREQRRTDRPGRGLREGEGPRDGQGPREGAGPRGDGFGPRLDGGGPGAILGLMRFDLDNDGKLNSEELAALQTEYETRHQQLVEQFDTDGDGRLSPEERRAAVAPPRRRAGAADTPDGPAIEDDRPRRAVRERGEGRERPQQDRERPARQERPNRQAD